MNDYENPLWSLLYDLIHSGDAADIDFYLRQAEAVNGPVLEVACGTGRILLPMIEWGIDAWGIDSSQPMLDRLAEKARRRNIVPRVVRADMRDFSLPQLFHLIIVPFRSFLHLDTQAEQIAALSCIRKHLSPEGRLILNISSPSRQDLDSSGRELPLAGELIDPINGRRLRVWQVVRNNPVNQLQTIDWLLNEIDERGRTVSKQSLSLNLHWIYRSEFEVLLKAAGYSRWTVFGGFNGERLEREDQEMVWIAYP